MKVDPKALEAVEKYMQAQVWVAETYEQERCARLVEYAMAHGKDPVRAVRGAIFEVGQEGIDYANKGLPQ